MKYGLLLIIFLAAKGAGSQGWLQYALFWSYPLALIGFGSLCVVIFKLVKMLGAARVARLPMAAENRVEIPEPGKFDICLEVPMFTFFAGSGLHYELISERDGRAVEVHSTAASLMNRNNGATATIIVRAFEIVEAGAYQLRVSGFKPHTDYSRYNLIVSRPTSLKAILYIFGILGSALMLAGGITFTAIAHSVQR